MASCLLGVLLVCPAAHATELEVTRLDGRTIQGRLVQLTPEIILASSGEDTALTWAEVLSLRPLDIQTAAMRVAEDAPLRFELADGSVFAGRIDNATDRGFTVRFRSDRTCRLDPSMLQAIRATSASAAGRAKLAEASAQLKGSEDIAVIERGSQVVVLRGVVRQISSARVRFAWEERELDLPWQRLVGLCFARPIPRRASCMVRLHSGDVFGGRVVAGDDTTVALQSGVFDRLELPWADIERVECHSERLTYLSDLVPVRYDFTPFFQKHWNYAYNSTLTGRPIRLAGRRFASGVTMHSRSALVYAIDGRYRQFAAVVGVVDEMADRGDVTLAIVGDGRVLWEARHVRGGEKPRDVLVDVTGVREFSLHVDFGDGLDLSDHACWALARLIR
jgi:hypothetical protein